LAVPLRRPTPKDGVNDHVVGGAATVNPERRGTKVACWHRIAIGAGETTEIRLRLARDTPGRTIDLGEAFTQTQAERSREADEYYAALRPEGRIERRRSDGDVASVGGNELELAIL
jgi:hypothetical protein